MPAILGCDGAGSGQSLLIHGGAGGVGHVAIQLAKLRGAKVYTTVGSSDKERLVRQLGADYPILSKQTDFVPAILQETAGKGVDIAFDTVGGETFGQTCRAVRVYGDMVTILEPRGSWKEARDRKLRISLELMLTPAAQKYQTEILKQGARLIDGKKLTIHLSQTFPLAAAISAHQLLETGAVTGKIALIID